MLSDDLALVQTVDFFAPIVDDPYLFGQIAAANALSDVFAMGGEPLTALNIVGFPSGKLPMSVLTEILRGGQEKVHEAGALIVGGHTIIDEELKYGLSVTGRVHPTAHSEQREREGRRPTRPHEAARHGAPRHGDEARESWNRRGIGAVRVDVQTQRSRESRRSRRRRPLRHRRHRLRSPRPRVAHRRGERRHAARSSRVAFRRFLASKRRGVAGREPAAPNGTRAYLESRVDFGSATELQRAILVDPQTSGGLLVAVPPDRVAEYLSLIPEARRDR